MTYAMMPFVIRRQVHDSRHIYNLERMDGTSPKLASALLNYDLIKNSILTDTLHHAYDQYEKYLGFHPVHRVLRASKHAIKKATHALEKWVFDPIISVTISTFTLGNLHGKYLKKAFNGTVGFTESITFALVKGIVHLPKHIYKDTRDLSRQLGRVLTGKSTKKGTWDALGRDTKGTRRLLKFSFNMSAVGWIWHKAHGTTDPMFQKVSNLFNAARVGVKAARHQAQIKKDMALAQFEIHLHESLHQWSPELIKSPYQLAASSYPMKYKQFKRDKRRLNEMLQAKLTAYTIKHASDIIKPKNSSNDPKKKLNSYIMSKISSYDPKRKLNRYLFSNAPKLKNQFIAIHGREVLRFKRQEEAHKFAHLHPQEALGLAREQLLINQLKKNVNSKIQHEWKSVGENVFNNDFIHPFSNYLTNNTKITRKEKKRIHKFYQSRQIGEKIFADILLGDLVSGLLHDSRIVTYAKVAGTQLDSTPFGDDVLRLLGWNFKAFVSRMQFIHSVVQISVKKKLNSNLFSIAPRLEKQLNAINEQEERFVLRIKREEEARKFAHLHPQEALEALVLVREQQLINQLKKNVNSQIQYDWTSGGQRLFSKIFIHPFANDLPFQNERSKAVSKEINKIQRFYQSRQIGERIFADILLGDLVSRLLHDRRIVTYEKVAGTQLDSTPFGDDVLRLLGWNFKAFVSRMQFVQSVAQISVNKTKVHKFKAAVKRDTEAISQSSSIKAFVHDHPLAGVDLQWYKKVQSSRNPFMKTWKKSIKKDATTPTGKLHTNYGVAAAWQTDVNEIKSGQSLSVGEIINSLEPNDDAWRLSLRPISEPEPATPVPSSNDTPQPATPVPSSNDKPEPVKPGPNVQPSEPITVNLAGFYGHIHFAKKLYNKSVGKKADPTKKDAEKVKDDAETEIDTAIETAEKDVAKEVEHKVDDVVDADITDTEALVTDAEIDILA